MRLFAADSLSRMGQQQPAIISHLAHALTDDNPLVCRIAAEALGEIGAPAVDAVPALLDALTNTDWGLRVVAANALGKIGPMAADAVPTLLESFHDPNPKLWVASAEALWNIQHYPEAVPLLGRILQDDRGVMPTWEAAQALERIGTPEALWVLRRYRK